MFYIEVILTKYALDCPDDRTALGETGGQGSMVQPSEGRIYCKSLPLIRTHACVMHMHTQILASIPVHVCACACTHTHTSMHAYMYTQTDL